ncbi:MAG: response regulator [Mariniblastus sp.]
MNRMYFTRLGSASRSCDFAILLAIFSAMALTPSVGIAQTSAPHVQEFSSQTMGIHSQISSVTAGHDGVIYAASMDTNELIAFDGANWFKIEVPTACWSIQTGKTGRIWLAQDYGIGYLQRNELGQFEYQEFECQELETDFDEKEALPFWDCVQTENGVRFANNYFLLDIDETTNPPTARSFLANKDEEIVNWDDSILVQNTSTSKIMVADGEQRVSLKGCPSAEQFDFVTKPWLKQNIFVRDNWRGLAIRKESKWQSFSAEFDQLNGKRELNWIAAMSGNRLGCGGRAGFFCFDQNGNVLYRVSLPELGTVLAWNEFPDNRIGVACESGFAVLTPQESRREWPLFKYKNAATHAIHCDDGIVSLCSESGFYNFDTADLSSTGDSNLTPIFDSASLAIVASDDEFLVASTSGIMAKKDDELKVIVDRPASDIVRLDKRHLCAVGLNGVATIYRVKDDSFEELNSFPTESDQVILSKQEQVIWQSEYHGSISALEYPDGFESERSAVGLDSEVKYSYAWVHGYLGDDFIVLTDSGILVSHLESTGTKTASVKTTVKLKRSKRYAALTETVSNNSVVDLIECGPGRIALIGNNRVMIHELVDGVYEPDAVTEWEFHPWGITACWDNKCKLFWQVEAGNIVAIDIDSLKKPPLRSPSVVAFTDDNIPESLKVLKHRGSVKFNFGVPLGEHLLENVEYQHRLNGLKNKWSDWSKISTAEFQGLPPGTYKFETRARTFSGESGISTLGFQVEHPWFFSWGAIATWVGLFGITIYGATAWRAKRLIKANRKMEQLVAERTEEIEQKKIEIRRKASLLDESEQKSESARLQSLDTLVSGIAHDFNNLLMVISANNELIKYSSGDECDQFADNNVLAIQSAADLCKELTDYSGSLPMELVLTSLNRVVDESRELIGNTARDVATVSFKLTSDDGATNILADARILKRALVNLVINAVECCKQGIVIETARDTLSANDLTSSRYVGSPPAPGEYCSLTVKDDGAGIQPEQMERLFDPFFSTKRLGRGLGLAIVMRIVGRFNGVVFVESVPGAGAQFKLCFPAMPRRGSAKSADSRPETDGLVRKLNILLVDDDSLVLDSTEQILVASNHQVAAFIDAKKALEAIFETAVNSPSFDCAIIDVSMPGMSGPDLAELILDKHPDMPIVLISGYSNSNLEIPLLNAPNISFLAKPFRVRQINEAIRGVVSQDRSAKVIK